MDPEIYTPTTEVPETRTLPVENGVGLTGKGDGPPSKSKRRKVIESIVLYSGFIVVGLTMGINGPTFLDLEILTGSTTDQVAFTFMGSSIAGFLGAIFAGIVICKYNQFLLLAVDFIPLALFQTAVPWSRNIAALAIFNALKGFFAVFYDAGGNVTLLSIWGKDNGPWMQALHFLFGVGGLLGPLIAKPFMYVKEDTEHDATTLPENTTVNSNVTRSPEEDIDLAEMKVWIAYLIVGIIAICICFALFAVYLAGDRKFKQIRKEEEKKKKEEGVSEEKCFKITLVGFVFFMAFTYCIVEMNYINFIVVYLVKHLGITKSRAASMNAAFWAAFTVGRALGIFITLVVRPQIMLALSVFGAVVFLSPQPFALMYPEWVMWLLIVGLGLSLSTTFATLITWTERYIKVEGMVGTTFMIAGALGDMIGPVTIGILFKTYGPGALMVFLFGVSIVTACTFCVAQFIAWRHGERDRDETEDKDRGDEDEHSQTEERDRGRENQNEDREMLPITESRAMLPEANGTIDVTRT